MINPKEKAQLQEMWSNAPTGGSADIPDGTYQFVILSARFHMSDKGRPQFKTKLRVKGGAEEYVGKELEINDNLETPENMGWFRKKLGRLGISIPEDFEELTDGTLAAQMQGKVFEGQAKTKNDFLNVYVNRLIGQSDAEPEAEAEAEPETEAEDGGLEEGQTVSWNGKTGEVVEVLDDGKVRVKADDGKTYRVAKELLKPIEAQAEEQEEAEESNGDGDSAELPTAEEVEGLPATEVKKVLKTLGIEAAKVKNPRAVLHGFATLAEDPKGKVELTEIAPLADALGVTIKKGTPIKDATKALAKAVQEKIS